MRNTPLSKDEKKQLTTVLYDMNILPKSGKLEIHVDAQGVVASVKMEMVLR